MLKIFILTIGLFQLAQSSSDLNCSKGPAYWCKSVQTAQECNAFQHCLDSVWTKHYKYVKPVVGDSFLAKSNTPNKCANCIQCLLNDYKVCPYLHLFSSEIKQLVDNKITPVAGCKLLQQCDNNDGKDIEIGEQLEEKHEDHRFECGLHPRNWCDNIESAMKCNAFDACVKNTWSKMSLNQVKLLKQDAAEAKSCSFCIYSHEKLQEILKEHPEEVHVKNYLTSACEILPSRELSDKCLSTVNVYFSQIHTLVSNKIDAGLICKLTDACPAAQSNEEIKQEEDKSFSEILKQAKIKIINEHEAQVKTPLQDSSFRVEKLKQSMGVGCELCTIVMNAAKFLVQNKVDNTKIFKFVEKELCGRLGGSLNQTCVDYVEQEGPLILAMLEKSVDAGLVCRAMGLCLKVQVSDDEASQPKFYDLNARTDMNCTLCKVVFTQVKQMLVNQQSTAKILDYINTNLCSRTGSRQETCKSLINAYGPTLLRIISQDIHPDQLCAMIGMCKPRVEKEGEEEVEMMTLIPAVKKQQHKNEVESSADPQCILCEFVINLVSKRLSQNTTEPELEKILQNVCNKAMPSNLRQECNQFVQQYGPIIINLLINQVEPERVCRFINLCPSHKQEESQIINNKQEVIKMIELNPPKVLKNNELIEETPSAGNRTIQCSLCIYAAEIIDRALESNKTDEQIVNELRQVCNLFPGDLKNQCSAFVDEYGPYILKLVAADIDPLQACTALRLCQKSSSFGVDYPVSSAHRQIVKNNNRV